MPPDPSHHLDDEPPSEQEATTALHRLEGAMALWYRLQPLMASNAVAIEQEARRVLRELSQAALDRGVSRDECMRAIEAAKRAADEAGR